MIIYPCKALHNSFIIVICKIVAQISKNGSKLDDFWLIFSSKSLVFGVCFGPGPEPLQTRVRVRELDPGTRVSDPGLDALILKHFGFKKKFQNFLMKNAF